MIKNLKTKLSILFMAAVISIFTVVFCLFIRENINLSQETDKHFFERMVSFLVYQMEDSEDYLTSLSVFENKYHFILQLKNSDNALLYQNNRLSSHTYDQLIKTFEIELKKEQTFSKTLTFTEQSGSFSFTTTDHQAYYGIRAGFITNRGDTYTLYALKEAKGFFALFKESMPFYVGTWLFVFISLLILSKLLIQKAMKPTEIAIQSQKEFIAAISHELKSPLAVILSSAEYIGTSGEISDEVKKQTAVIDGECVRIAKLTQDLLLLSSVDTNTWSLNKKEIDVDTLLIRLYEKYEPISRKKELLFQLEMPEELFPALLADETRLNQILSILIDNAMNYSPEGGTIQLAAAIAKSTIVFRVVDHGTGIKEADKPYIYDRFFCADKSRTQREHYGLGLSIAKELIDMHRGNIRLEDTLGGGCTFIVSIPVA